MVAYSFKKQFVSLIRDGKKQQTIRAYRYRHVRVGEEVQLYCGMRTKHCFLIARGRCIDIQSVRLAFRARRNSDWVRIATFSNKIDRPSDLNEFARRDGFHDWAHLREFWHINHPGIANFSGVLIRWESLP